MIEDNMPVRVLQVVTDMNRGGLETMLMNYYRNIDRSKVQFDFLVHREKRAAYDDEIEALGGKIFRISRLIPWNRNYLKELDRFFADHPEYKIVHVHQDCLSSVILRVAKEHNVQVRIAHSHSSSQDKNIKYPIKLFYKRSISKYATDLFACGKAAGDWMFGGAEFSIINNAIDVKKYTYDLNVRDKMRKSLGIDGKFVIGHVGRFFYPKNHSYLIDIFARLINKEPDPVLLLVGDGIDMEKMQIKVSEIGIADKVKFLGIRSDIAELMQAMDVFVFPSLYEGLPLTLVEAQSAGLPCIISDRIPVESIMVDDLVEVIKLSDDIDIWVEKILGKRNFVREDQFDKIATRGFDIKTEVKKLEEYYINSYEQQK